ncbi:TetR/AcrR family transcriptional regulator [Robertkochia marina]|uniref:TetR/AcrR family transcriptional regulator n=1 Tax=Robertkochia marina TaxID=1227945 RepID=A0A4S3M0X0_9FLAO|nr:TetR/AcrR family transcriptional regulator [Robertkochia marina]THD67991.1 TetR/AcrR family transcriptional regulator [Robertkochia marina]TRZ41513.1 TetR/AcrR family transcriptional regulator [Robertkochia marina]
MITKAERTTQFITETIAPIFNRKGYEATSLNDITAATGLTKGAVYGNFKNKENLYLQCFDHLAKTITSRLQYRVSLAASPMEGLFHFTTFYKEYLDFTSPFGGCPIINYGSDSKHLNPEMNLRVLEVADQIEKILTDLIEQGKAQGTIRKNINGPVYAKRFFSLIQGAVFMSQVSDDASYLSDAMNVIIDTMNQRFKI